MTHYTERMISESRSEVTRLKTLIMDLTDGDYKSAEDIQRQTGHSLGKCHEMLRDIDAIKLEAARG
jgi:hypothetical protein